MIKVRKRLVALLCVAGLLLCNTSLVKAASNEKVDNTDKTKIESVQKSEPIGRRKVRVGWYPIDGLHEVKRDGTYSGYDFEYLQAIAQYTNWDYEYVVAPFQKCLEMLKEGKLDLMGAVAKSEERSQYLDYAQFSAGVGGIQIITTVNNPQFTYGDYQKLNGKSIGAINSDFHQTAFYEMCRQYEISPKLELFESQEELIRALNQNEIDAALVSRTRNNRGYQNIGQIKYEDFYFATKKGNKELMRELNYAMDMIHENQAFLDSTLQEKYFFKKQGQRIVYSEKELAYLKQNPVITVCMRKERFPYESYNEKTGETSGIATALLQKIKELTGLNLQIKQEDSVNITDSDLVLCFPYSYYWASQNNMRITKPYMKFQLVSVHNANNDLFGTKIGLLANQFSTYLVEGLPDTIRCEYKYYNSVQECFDAVLNGEVDSCIANSYEADYYMEKDDIVFFELYSKLHPGCRCMYSSIQERSGRTVFHHYEGVR